MRALGLVDQKLLEMILIGAYQISWFRFFYVGTKMVEEKKGLEEPFQSYISLAEDTFGSLTGGPKPRADPPGIDIKAIYNCEVLASVVKCISSLLGVLNRCPVKDFNHAFVHHRTG